MADRLNHVRSARVSQLMADFHSLQHSIADAPAEPEDPNESSTQGWITLRQCALDGQHILNCAAETRVPRVHGDPEEQAKAELLQVMLDAYARRHEAQKIYLRQVAAQQWVGWRAQVLRGETPHSGHTAQLAACDAQLAFDLAGITDESIYADLRLSDYQAGRWIDEDPSLRQVLRWLRARR